MQHDYILSPEHPGLRKTLAHFARPSGPDLITRTERYLAWHDTRLEADLWSYCRSFDGPPGPVADLANEGGRSVRALNFGGTDYLGLSVHAEVIEAGVTALRTFSGHVPSSGMLQGNTRFSAELERRISELLLCEHVALFPTGWAAGYGVISALVRPYDHVVLDNLAHSCLQAGAQAATANVRHHEHLAVDDLRRHLSEIRSSDTRNGILVVSEGLFSMDSDYPDLVALQDVCREFGATFLVDVSHDLGSTGPDGSGLIGAQKLLGKVDLVMGALSKNFAATGGFVATNSRAVRQFIRAYAGTHVFSTAISAVQCALASAAIAIVRSTEGQELRDRLSRNIHLFRDELARRGVQCLGTPTAIVPVLVGAEGTARVAGSIMVRNGLFTNVIEFPAVPMSAARFRMLLMATHTEEHIRAAAEIVADSIRDANAIMSSGAASGRNGTRDCATAALAGAL